MKRAAWLLLLGLLAACGGGGPPGTEVTVTLQDNLGSPAYGFVAFRVGEADWEMARERAPGVYTFNLPAGQARYGVAVTCPANILQWWHHGAFVYLLTTEDTVSLTVRCARFSGSAPFDHLEVSWDVRNVGGDRVWVQGWSSDNSSDSSQPLVLPGPVGEPIPFLAVAYDGSYSDWSKTKGLRRFSARVPGHYSLNFDPDDAVDFNNGKNVGKLRPFDAPANYQASYRMEYLLEGGVLFTSHPLGPAGMGEGDNTGGGFLRVPHPAAGDLYLLHTFAEGTRQYLLTRSCLTAEGIADRLEAPSFPDPWPSGYQVDPAPLPSFALDRSDHPTAYRVTLRPFPGSNRAALVVWVSRSWLGSDRNLAIPDLTALAPFAALKARPGERLEWEAAAIFSTPDFGEWLGSTYVYPSHNHPYPVFPGGVWKEARVWGSFVVP